MRRNGTERKTLLILAVATDFCTRCQMLRPPLGKFGRLSARNVLCLSCLMSLICCVYTYFSVKFTDDPPRVYTKPYTLNIRLFAFSPPHHIFTSACDLRTLYNMCIRVLTSSQEQYYYRIDILTISVRATTSAQSRRSVIAAAGFWRAETLVK